MPSDEPSRPYNWRPKSLAKLKLISKCYDKKDRFSAYLCI